MGKTKISSIGRGYVPPLIPPKPGTGVVPPSIPVKPAPRPAPQNSGTAGGNSGNNK